ncbi:Protein kinase A anchor protein nuclear localization signal domain [Trinorchestia longiramus]|nr:Protein kinase A anchor protein nuclear localization signal domain [Trinorchestia longiramus]
MVSSKPAMFPHLIDVATLHLTLFVFHLQEDDLSVAKTCMASLESKLKDENSKPSITLNFRNLRNFSNRVVFVSITEDESYEELLALRLTALQVFEEAGIVVQDDEDWNPHLTIAKISYSRKSSDSKTLRKIPASIYADYKENEFGVEHVSAVQLLSMTQPKDSRRYYQCESSVLLHPGGDPGDHTACCFPRRPARPQLHEAAATPLDECADIKSLDDTNVINATLDAEDSISGESLNTNVEQHRPSESTINEADDH